MAYKQSYEAVGRLFGRDYIKLLGRHLDAAGILVSPEAFAGLYMLLSAAVCALLAIAFVNVYELRMLLFKFALLVAEPLVVAFSSTIPILAFIFSVLIAFSVLGVLAYVGVLMMADARRKTVEDCLPDFLVLCAANVRAGMTIDQAMWYSAKPEFGILSSEVNVVAKRTFGGVPFARALDSLQVRFDSKTLRRTVLLIKQGLASGGRMAEILERTAQDARDMQIIRQEIAASLLMYVIFIAFAVVIGTPFLFGVAAKLVVIMESVFTQLPDTSNLTSVGGMTLIHPQAPIISSGQFQIFVLLSSIVTAICSSLMIGAIQNGNARAGIRYLPFMLIAGTVVFLLVSTFLDLFMGRISGGV